MGSSLLVECINHKFTSDTGNQINPFSIQSHSPQSFKLFQVFGFSSLNFADFSSCYHQAQRTAPLTKKYVWEWVTVTAPSLLFFYSINKLRKSFGLYIFLETISRHTILAEGKMIQRRDAMMCCCSLLMKREFTLGHLLDSFTSTSFSPVASNK